MVMSGAYARIPDEPTAASIGLATKKEGGTSGSPDGGAPGARRMSAANVPGIGVPKKPPLVNKPQVIKTGRQRKKTATRAKGGEFRAKTEKKRVYFCCISAEVEMETLQEGLKSANIPDWEIEAYTSVIHIYMRGSNETAEGEEKPGTAEFADEGEAYGLSLPDQNLWKTESKEVFIFDFGCVVFWGFSQAEEQEFIRFCEKFIVGDPLEMEEFGASEDDMAYVCKDSHQVLKEGRMSVRIRGNKIANYDLATWNENVSGVIGVGLAWEKKIDDDGEVAETAVEKGLTGDGGWMDRGGESEKEMGEATYEGTWKGVGDQSLEKGSPSPDKGQESDYSPFNSKKQQTRNESDGGGGEKQGSQPTSWLPAVPGGHIYLENDLYTISKYADPRERLALSFAMAQSSILAVFEARIQKKVEEFRYIPETFATNGKVRISGKRLGNMIGEVFVVRHDVNLHTEILDTPDWFWNNRDVEDLYKMVSEYLEMDSRTAILNKRLDMLREMLTMLQLQNENEHSVKLEWIVILLIAASCAVEMVTVAGKYLNYWK